MTAAASWYAVHGPNGDLSWRVTGPAEAIGARVNLIPNDDGVEALWWPNRGDAFPWSVRATHENGDVTVASSRVEWEAFNAVPQRLTSLGADYPAHEGAAAVFTRPMAWLAAHALRLRENGVRVVAECDDNYMSPSHLNTFMARAGYGDDDRDSHARSICATDAIILSTEYLRDYYYKTMRTYFKGLPLPEMHVCRNHVDEKHIPEVVPHDGPLRVGFMGSQSHLWDIDLIWPAMKTAYDMGYEIVFVGMNPLESVIDIDKVGRAYWKRLSDRWGSLEYTVVPWRMDYRGTALPIDIGLAPLVTNEYTLCKSDIKIMEYALSGAPCVAQNNLVFNRTFVHGETALLASSPAEFVTSTVALLKDPKLRERLVANAMEYVRGERLLSKNADEWREAVLG